MFLIVTVLWISGFCTASMKLVWSVPWGIFGRLQRCPADLHSGPGAVLNPEWVPKILQ